MKKEPTFTTYLTTRGLNNKGVICSLESIPLEFHKYVTIFSSKENRRKILSLYPDVQYHVSGEELNTAAKKRTYLFQHTPEVDHFFLLNDEIKLSIAHKGKIVAAREHPKEFLSHILRMEELALEHVGIGAATTMFNHVGVADKQELTGNKLLGSFFYWNKKFANKKLILGRQSFYEDLDYSLQALQMGYRTPHYLGILYSPRSTKPQRQHNDRTQKIQEKDARDMMNLYPGIISMKKDFDINTDSMIIDVKYAKAYTPRMNVLFVCHGNLNRSAAAQIILSRKLKNIHVKSCGVKDDAGGQITAKKTRTALATLGITTQGIRSSKATKKLINWADVVFYMDASNLKRLTEQFPKDVNKFVLLAKYIGESRIADPGFISDQEKVVAITEQIKDAILAWIKAGKPIPESN